MIEFKNVSVSYGTRFVYDKLNLKINDNEITAILGENGSGKTTILKALANLIDYSGEIIGVPDKISYVFQEDRLIKNLTVKENIKLVSPNVDVKSLLKIFNMEDVENRYIKTLSGGKKRKVALIRAFSYKAPLLILDEAFNSVDLKSKTEFIEIFKRKQKEDESSIIFITHDILEAVLFADRIIVMSGGEIVFDKRNTKTKETEKELYKLLLNLEDKN